MFGNSQLDSNHLQTNSPFSDNGNDADAPLTTPFHLQWTTIFGIPQSYETIYDRAAAMRAVSNLHDLYRIKAMYSLKIILHLGAAFDLSICGRSLL